MTMQQSVISARPSPPDAGHTPHCRESHFPLSGANQPGCPRYQLFGRLRRNLRPARPLRRRQEHFAKGADPAAAAPFRRLGPGPRKPLVAWGQDYFEAIGVGFELPNHYIKFTAVENLRFFASLYKKKSRYPQELLALVELQNAAHKKMETFSKGMRMRLNFVRAIQHDPEILFLDEPTAGLDPVNAGTIKRVIAELRHAGKTILLTAYNMNDVDQLCDRVSFMVGGRFAALDAPGALKARYGRRFVRVTHGKEVIETDEFPLDGLADNQQFHAVLKAGAVRTLHSQEASLDQVFSDVTGMSLDRAEEAL